MTLVIVTMFVWIKKSFSDNNGEIDIEEMANIIDTLDCIEGVHAGTLRYDENGHPIDTPSAKTRAEDLFSAIDKNNDGGLTLDEFLFASSRMTEVMKKQDALEQKKKLWENIRQKVEIAAVPRGKINQINEWRVFCELDGCGGTLNPYFNDGSLACTALLTN